MADLTRSNRVGKSLLVLVSRLFSVVNFLLKSSESISAVVSTANIFVLLVWLLLYWEYYSLSWVACQWQHQ